VSPRVLVASTGGAGHFGPLVPFVEALAARGDELLLVVPAELQPTVAALGHPFELGPDPPPAEVAALRERFAAAPAREASILANRELFGRLCTTAMLPTAERACREWRPDLVLRETTEYASAVAAERCGVAHAQVAISLAEVEAASLELAAPALAQYGIVERLRESPYLTRFPASLDPSPFPDTRRFREPGAPTAGRPAEDDAPLVYVTFGSVAGGLPNAAALYRTALEAVDGLAARVLLTVGPATDAAALGPVPANTRVEAWVPQAEVLGEAALVVAHGGSGTTFGTLAAGVPLVIVPLFADQLANAQRVGAAGAALVVEPDRAEGGGMGSVGPHHVPRLRAAIETVLAEPAYARAAGRVAEEMRAQPSIDELLATLVAA
jgi:UDP:flavonoid glycosyltransferase YjiC (YdhE family)